MRLPGGILHDGERRRDFAFRPLTGAVELAMADAHGYGGSRPALVTAILAAALAQVGGLTVEPATVANLAVGDRQFLMRRLATLLGRGETWLTTRCAGCNEQFDFCVDQALLPVKEAGEGYPFATALTSRGEHRFRVPTGADQELLATAVDEEEARQLLVQRCLAPVTGPAAPGEIATARGFTPADISRIEEGLEAVAPEVATAIQAACPACATPHVVTVDPYGALAGAGATNLLQEVHRLAAAYHWSEPEILALPTGRRRQYLELIDRARGMAH